MRNHTEQTWEDSSRRGQNQTGKPCDDELPPHDEIAEGRALACVVAAKDDEAGSILNQLFLEDFYDLRHQRIYRSLKVLQSEGKPLDTSSLYQFLRDKGLTEEAGGDSYIFKLADQTPSPATFPTHFGAVRDRASRRAVVRDASEVLLLARDLSIPGSTMTDVARRLFEVYSSEGRGLTIRRPDELLAMSFDDSDRILGDRLLAKGQSLVIIGAGSLGKSRLLLQLAVASIIGRPFLAFETHCPGLRWLILQAENSNRRLQADFKALQQWAGSDWPRVIDQLLIHTLETDTDGFLSLDDQHTQDLIAQEIQRYKPDIVAWDSLYNFAIGDLNKDEDMNATLQTISRLTRAGNPQRSPVVLHHALTGKAGAARAIGYDRSSHGRNSKVLFAWTRGQINIAPGRAQNNETLVLSCGKCSNGKEFATFAIQLKPQTMIYEVLSEFDLESWKAEVGNKENNSTAINNALVREQCREPRTKPELVLATMAERGCSRSTAYRRIKSAEQAGVIHFTKA